jgi:hypothetical protein
MTTTLSRLGLVRPSRWMIILGMGAWLPFIALAVFDDGALQSRYERHLHARSADEFKEDPKPLPALKPFSALTSNGAMAGIIWIGLCSIGSMLTLLVSLPMYLFSADERRTERARIAVQRSLGFVFGIGGTIAAMFYLATP